MRVTKYFKPKNDNGEYEEKVYFAVDGKNVDMADGEILEDKIKDINKTISSNTENVNSLNGKHTILQAKVGAQGNDIADLKTKTANLENSITTSNSSITNLQTSVTNLNSNVSKITSTVQSNSTNISEMQNDITTLDNNVSSINSVLSTTCRLEATSLTCTLPDNL